MGDTERKAELELLKNAIVTMTLEEKIELLQDAGVFNDVREVNPEYAGLSVTAQNNQ